MDNQIDTDIEGVNLEQASSCDPKPLSSDAAQNIASGTAADPNEAVAAPDEAVAAPNEAVAAPNEAVAAPDEAVAAPDEAVAAPDEAVAAPDEAVATPNEAVATPNEAVVARAASDLSLRERFALFLKRREIRRFLSAGYRLIGRGKKSLAVAKLDEARNALSKLKATLPSHDIATLDEALKSAEAVVTRQLRSVKKSTAREVLESLIFALIFALILRTFFIEPFKIPTRSMVPTLLDGDRLFVTKLSYGIRMPFLDDYVVSFSEPQRGEVVVFAFPQKEAAEHLARSNFKCMQAEAIAGEKDYIKRIIGVEGDSIEVIDQIVHVNGEPIAQQAIYQREVSDYFYLSDRRREIWNRESHGGAEYTTITHSIALNHFGPIKVAPGHVFVMGDNRDNSSDSRCWGQVPVKNIKGRAQILWWSAGSHGPRWSRIFTRIY